MRAFLHVLAVMSAAHEAMRVMNWTVPPSTGGRLARRLPASRLVLLPGCGDFPHEERPGEVGAAVAEFPREPAAPAR